MDVRHLTDEVAVSPQISVSDIEAIAAKGFRSVICNRPDGESLDQPDYAEIEAAARKAGLEFRYQPIVGGQLGIEDAEEFGKSLEELPRPIFAYCRSGTRSATLWSLSQAGNLPADDILQSARNAGYDMSAFADYLRSR